MFLKIQIKYIKQQIEQRNLSIQIEIVEAKGCTSTIKIKIILKMKLFVAILVLVAAACVAGSEEWTVKNGEQIREIRIECLKEHPLSTEQMGKMKNFDFPNEEAVRKYLLCTAEKMDIYCPEMGYHADRIGKQFKMDMEEEEVTKLAEDCIKKFPKGDKANDVAAFEVHTCLMGTTIGEKVKNFIKKRNDAAQKPE